MTYDMGVQPKQVRYGAPTPTSRAGSPRAPSALDLSSSTFTPDERTTANAQGEALRNPGAISAETPVNPLQQAAFDASKKYSDELAGGTNAEITRALSRGRDEISVGMRAEGEAAMSRGADPTLFRTRALQSGQRNLNDLEGRLTDVALGRRAESNRDLTSAAGGAASEQRQMHLGTLASQLEGQRNLTAAAETQSRLYQAPYDRLLAMMQSVAGNRDAYGGLTGGDGGGVIGGGSTFPQRGGVFG